MLLKVTSLTDQFMLLESYATNPEHCHVHELLLHMRVPVLHL